MNNETFEQALQKKVLEKVQHYEAYKVEVGVSNHHVHLSRADIDKLFGAGYILTKKADLGQPGQYAANETVTIMGPKGRIEKVRILGPERKESQIEISKTESFRLGVKAPIVMSGELDGTPGIILLGPQGAVELKQGVIVAKRHVHMTPPQAAALGLQDKQIVDVETFGERHGIMGDVVIRVSEASALEMHIDVDEANAFALKNKDYVMIRK